MSVEKMLGYPIAASEKDVILDHIGSHIQGDTRCKYLACFNPHSYAVAKNHDVFQKALLSSSWLVPDGIGVVYVSRFKGKNIRSRFTGFDVFSGVCSRLNAKGAGRVFFLGASEDTLIKIKDKFQADYPNLTIAGTYSPPYKPTFSDSETDEMIHAVNEAKADVLWVGMTSPKQDIWLYENHKRLNVPFAAGIGAVFDFYCGNVKRSHPVFQKIGLEWLPRLVQEPKRLWKRMFVSAPIFVFDSLKEK